MVLVGEIQEPTRHASLLEHIEEPDACGNGDAIVVVAVNDELGRAELEDSLWARGVCVMVGVAGLPEGTVELII